MDKFGRKASGDPQQEALRKHKDKWNQEASDLINELIALKRGLNGRGDKEKGLPVSSIKDPLPTEIVSYINDVANSASKLIQEAKSIADHQRNYSQTRRKKKSLSEQDKEIIKMAEMLSYASWWGSRFIAKFRTSPEQRSMINSLESTLDSLKDFEDTILSSKTESIPSSFTKLIKIINEYNGTYVKQLKKLGIVPVALKDIEKIKNLKEKEEKRIKEKQEKEAKALAKKEEKEKLSREREERQQAAQREKEEALAARRIQEETDRQIVPVPEVTKTTRHDRMSSMIAEKSSAKSFIETVLNNKKLFSISSEVSDRLDKFERSVDYFEQSFPKSTQIQIESMSEVLEGYYKDLVKTLYIEPPFKYNKKYNSQTGQWEENGKTAISQMPVSRDSYSFFNDLLTYLSSIGALTAMASSYSNYNEYIIKNASLANWLKANILNIEKNIFLKDRNFKEILLNTYKTSKEIRKYIDEVLNDLETPKVSMESLVSSTNKLNQYFIEIVDLMLSLADSYASTRRRLEKSKESYKVDISTSDITKLKSFKTTLSNIKFEIKSPDATDASVNLHGSSTSEQLARLLDEI